MTTGIGRAKPTRNAAVAPAYRGRTCGLVGSVWTIQTGRVKDGVRAPLLQQKVQVNGTGGDDSRLQHTAKPNLDHSPSAVAEGDLSVRTRLSPQDHASRQVTRSTSDQSDRGSGRTRVTGRLR